jgi:hypothetical protein
MNRLRGAWSAAGLALALACVPAGPGRANESLGSMFEELAGLIRHGEWGPVEWARGSVLGAQILRVGAPGVPHMRGRFVKTADPVEAFLSGAYVAIHGEGADHVRMRKELETNPAKRAWLKSLVGDARAVNASLREGEHWRQAAGYLPAMGGYRRFCQLCMESKDALVRRAGLYWGYWVADDAYQKTARRLARSDPDALLRQLAAQLAAHEAEE